ncbi:MAG: WbqC family protein [Paludibacteraceae bacterium]|nr:WbqC family protein [Paludibacteraceae bacterium]
MIVLPTAYLAPEAWFKAFFKADEVQIEVQESFVKQTYRNRCLIHDAQGNEIVLTVPVMKVEHKQLTRNVQISYQQHWQHQHWMALKSAYGKSPYWDYYADFFAPFYTGQTKWLIELNEGLHDVIVRLLHNQPNEQLARLAHTTSYMQADLEQYWGNGTSILDTLMERGPLAGVKE